MEKEPMIFTEGMTFKARAENAPESVRGGIYFKYPEFARFMEKHKNDKGWVNVKMMKSKDKGSIYFILDTWKPTVTDEQKQASENYHNRYNTDENPKEAQNQKEAKPIFESPMSPEELKSLDQIPF